jgi:malonyl-CoA O-methyltransferase
MADARASIDRRIARRRFERAARSYAHASRVEAEVGARMLERLDYVRAAPRRILDAGAGPSREARALAARYRGASVIALDYSLAMLREARRGARGVGAWLGALRRRARPSAWWGSARPSAWWGSARPSALCADLERLPLADGSVGLVWSNMVLHWLDEPLAALREMHRVLEPGGLLMFSMLGPDSLKELRQVAGRERVHDFIDMHDVGDRLIAAGFAAPVMDMEMLKVKYAAPERLLDDLRLSGQTLARSDARRGLAGRNFRARLIEDLRGARSAGEFCVTYEIVYGHAWKHTVARSGGAETPAPLRFVPRIRK